MPDTDRAAWKVDFTLPPTEERRWTRNENATVVAASLERAAEVVREHYPNCTLVALHRVGSERQVLIDSVPNDG